MNLQQVAMTTFVLLQATWPIEKSRQLIERLKPSHVIVRSHIPQDAYFLFSAQEVFSLFSRASDSSFVREALRLEERGATPGVESDTDAEQVPDQCIVLEDGRLVGFFDVTVPPQWSISRRGEGEHLPSGESRLALRSVVAEFPEQVQVQTVFSLLVSLSASPTPETGLAFPLALPLGTSVDIVVQPRRGFILEENGEGTLVVSSEEETLPLQFKLRGVAVGPGQLRVLAFHRGQPLGALTLRVAVLEAPIYTSAQRLSQEQPLEPVRIHQPDLSLLILEHTDAGQPAFTFRLTAQDPALELNLKPFGPIRLKVDALQYFQEFFKDIEALPLKSSKEKAIAEQRLAAKGAVLFTDLLPADLQLLLWSLQSRIQSVQVQSEEPWIPWELCKLCGREDGRVVEGPFLCEDFALTRWLPGIALKPALKLENLALVVPADSGLAFAVNEQDYVLSLTNRRRHITRIPARFLEVREALASGVYDGWHFSGHGGFRESDPNRSAIYLENQETLTPEDLSGKVSNLGRAKPVVFFNACQIGRSAMSLTDIGGWARQFLRAGAGAFIGAYWSIYDQPAYDFAQNLYSRLLNGIPIGRAVQQARTAIKLAGDPTWLAYTVFADPLARVQEGTSSPL
jgi:CHAT domain